MRDETAFAIQIQSRRVFVFDFQMHGSNIYCSAKFRDKIQSHFTDSAPAKLFAQKQFVNERVASLGATFKYSLDLFERPTIERLRDALRAAGA